MKKYSKGFGVIELLAVIVIVGILAAVGWLMYNQQSNNQTDDKTNQNNPKTSSQSPAVKGTITGTPSFPSSSIPRDEKVCAVSISDSSKVYCDNVGEKQTVPPECSRLGAEPSCDPPPLVKFTIQVPAGDYHVYASTETKKPGYKAYYNEHSKCGYSVNCPPAGHTQYIKVSVVANAVVDDVDPGDWYAE